MFVVKIYIMKDGELTYKNSEFFRLFCDAKRKFEIYTFDNELSVSLIKIEFNSVGYIQEQTIMYYNGYFLIEKSE